MTTDYFKVNSIASHDLINYIKGGIKEFNRKKNTSLNNIGIRIGNIVDFKLTESDKHFNDYFYVIDSYPTDKWKTLCDCFYITKDINIARERAKYKWSVTKLRNMLYEEKNKKSSYLNALYSELQIVSEKEVDIATKVVDSLLQDKYTSLEINSSQNQILFQLEIYWERDGIACKSKLDVVEIDHTNKIIYLKDIKTTAKQLKDFSEAVEEYLYDIQLVFYYNALNYWKDHNGFQNYTVDKNFKWIVESTTDIGDPLNFVLSAEKLTNAFLTEQIYWEKLLKQLQSKEMKYDYDYIENGGIKII
jgi:hypothetical protein